MVSQRRVDIGVDSVDLGVYIFQEYSFRKWLDPNLEGSDCNVQALSAAQRYAAALLLFFDDFHFKRRQTVHVSGVSSKGSCIEGGYKPLDYSIVLHKQGDAFMQHYEKYLNETAGTTVSTSTSPYYNAFVLRTLRAIESYAVSPARVPPASAVKHILKRLDLPFTPKGAQTLLSKMQKSNRYTNQKNSNNSSSNNNAISSSSTSAAGRGESTQKERTHTQITAWPEGVVDSAVNLAEYVKQRRTDLLKTEMPAKVGKKGPAGRLDFRGAAAMHPVICLDNRRTSFFDDGFSLSPETGELLIHIADVTDAIRKFPSLANVAKERVNSVFTPQGPLHMLPPQALDALKLSSDAVNEAITVGVSVEFETGRLIGTRVFPSLIGPAINFDISTVSYTICNILIILFSLLYQLNRLFD